MSKSWQIWQRFDLILARESYTYEMLLEKGLRNVKRCADPAFTMDAEELKLPAGWKEDRMVGLNYSPLVYERNRASKKAIHQLIEHILEHTSFSIALTPHVIEHGNDDAKILRDFYHDFRDSGRVILLPDHLGAMQYKGYIRRMRLFIGARTHATIAAYSSHVPTMVLGYSVKSKGIANDLFGEEKLVLSIDELSNTTRLIESFQELVQDEARLKLHLKRMMPDVRRWSHDAVHHLLELVKGVPA